MTSRAARFALGAATFSTIMFAGGAVTDYFVEGRLTAAYVVARTGVLGLAWLVAVVLVVRSGGSLSPQNGENTPKDPADPPSSHDKP